MPEDRGRSSLPYFNSEIGRYLAFLFFAFFATNASGQRYEVGDIVENFTLIDRATNQEVSLYDLEGKVIFLEWFAYWCPFCQAAAADIGPGIVDYYRNLGGNPNEVEFIHIGLNLQGGAETQTQDFVTFYGIQQVLNDFDRAVSNRFQPSNQPIFAIINGVAGSPSHKQWELLYTALGYGDLSAPIATFRAAIDSVEAAASHPPEITVHPIAQILESRMKLTLVVTATSEETLSYQWKRDGSDIAGATSSTYTLSEINESDAGEYSVTVANTSGSVDSQSATIEVIRGYLDSLIAQGVPENERAYSDDPDHDGAPNALEFLSRTHANDPGSCPKLEAMVQVIENASYLTLSYTIDPKISSIAAHPEFSIEPTFATDMLNPVPLSESTEDSLQRRTYRAQVPVDNAPQFARLLVLPISP